jgi:hypothetical protein
MKYKITMSGYAGRTKGERKGKIKLIEVFYIITVLSQAFYAFCVLCGKAVL